MAIIYEVIRTHSTGAPLESTLQANSTVKCICADRKRPVDKLIEEIVRGDSIRVMPYFDAFYPVASITPLTVED